MAEEVTYASLKFNNQIVTPVSNQHSNTSKKDVQISKQISQHKNFTDTQNALTKELQQLKRENKRITSECITPSDNCYKTTTVNEYTFTYFPLGGKLYNNHYYFMSNDQLNWNESREWCKTWDSDLVIINSTEEQEFLAKEIKMKNNLHWIGLTDAAVEGVWKWVDQSLCKHKDKQTTYFFDNEPDNFKHSSKTDEDCGIMRPEDGKWGDVRCNDKYQWICEKQANVCSS
ncbi:CD209 antigen-like protein 2 isoform X2 [Protopterus annectens]|uniref:CD209 antigen-like protein 2 isoform X2 n=1 Tax=Protopterus annectens TaxID=7888 RepID=UPI001CFA4FBB|nr:CD209 antigen-like protein 2 isoform X2 [Protopterus annectens]